MDALQRWLPFGVGSGAAALFALLAGQSFSFLDSAELSAAGVGLGSPHPTGFPLYMMMVKAAALVPVGEIAHRVNLLSAVCGGATVGLVVRLIIAAGRGGRAALAGSVIGALALASSLLFARHAVIAEVYVANALLFAATLVALDRAAQKNDAGSGLVLAVVFALGCGLHTTFRIALVVPVAVFLWQRLRRGARWPLYAPLVIALVALSMQLYLPVRSVSGDPALDWGHPRTAAKLVDHLSAARIRAAFADEIASSTPEVVQVNLREHSRAVFDGVGPAALLLGLIGVVWLAARRRRRTLAVALGLTLFVDFIYSFWIHPMGIEDGQNGALFAVALAVLAGVGASWFLARSERAAPYVGAVVGLLVALAPAWLSWSTLASASRTEVARTVADAAVEGAQPRAIVLAQSDALAGAAIFLAEIEGARPDVSFLVRQQLGDRERTIAVARLDADAEPSFAALVATGRPLAWEIGDDALPAGFSVRLGAPLVELFKPEAAPFAGEIEATALRVRELFADARDPLALRNLAIALTNLGRVAFGRGSLGLASQLFDAAIIASPSYASALINRGVVASRIGDFESALAVTLLALDVEPNRVQGLLNAARYEAALGNKERARRHLSRALAVEPRNARVLAELEALGRPL